jgi:hypothetical protein
VVRSCSTALPASSASISVKICSPDTYLHA